MEAVAITGLGVFTPDHSQPELLFSSIYQGRSMLKSVTLCQESGFSQICSPIEQDQLSTLGYWYPQIAGTQVARSAKFAFYSALQAVKQAKLTSAQLTDRAGIFVGCNKNVLSANAIKALWQKQQNVELSAQQQQQIEHELGNARPDQAAQLIARELDMSGMQATLSDACTAGATAFISGQRRILSGELDIAICGATEHATADWGQMPFYKLGATSQAKPDQAQQAYRPFDKDRTGVLLADGAAFVVLESVEHAKQRGVEPLAYLVGSARQSEAHKMTSTTDDGHYYQQCIEQALKSAKLKPEHIQHINAHGTSTPANDKAEGHAIFNTFGDAVSVTSTKSALGHSLAASGAIEAVLVVETLRQQRLLPTQNFVESGADEANIQVVTQGRKEAVNLVMSNSFGFGGVNASLIFAKDLAQVKALQGAV